MKENDRFPTPIITPTTKAAAGRRRGYQPEDIIAKGIVSEEDYTRIESYTQQLFKRGSEIAASHGLILVDTKYEFGKDEDGTIRLIDEIHTPTVHVISTPTATRSVRQRENNKTTLERIRTPVVDRQRLQGRAESVPEMPDTWLDEISSRWALNSTNC